MSTLLASASFPMDAVAYGRSLKLTPPSQATLDRLATIQAQMLELPQVPTAFEHVLHGGMYARTIRLAPGLLTMGSLINRATILVLQGDCSVVVGDDRVDFSGYNVLPGSPGRKQLFLTRGPVEMTMIFPTAAQTVEEAEDEVFAEADQLESRKEGNRNLVIISGPQSRGGKDRSECQVLSQR